MTMIKNNEMVVNLKSNGMVYKKFKIDLKNPYTELDDIENIRVVWNPNELKQLAITLWTTSGILFTNFNSASAKTSVWKEMQPVFGVFQDMAMVLGALAIIVGLVIMMFRKNTGWKVASTAALVILGCFLVPAVVMLVAIVGGMLNDILTQAFDNMNLRDSVKVGG